MMRLSQVKKMLAGIEGRKLVAAGKLLHARNMLAGCDGNLSCRLKSGYILMTPTQTSKLFLKTSDLVILSPKHEVLLGKPSSEMRLHLEVFSRCPEAMAVMHAHPPSAIAWTLAHPDATQLPGDLLPEVILACGRIPVAEYARPGTPELAQSIRPFLPDHRAILLARHGAVCWGASIDEAYFAMERVEHIATILHKAAQLGPARPLPPVEIEALERCRKLIGPKVI